MKKIGIIGGMSWESTALYYQWINREIAIQCGGLNSAKILIHSLNFSEIAALQRVENWGALASMLASVGRQLQDAGAECILIATNTMHLVANEVGTLIDVPLIHIVDVTAEAINQKKLSTVGLLGTRFTMEKSFYSDRLLMNGIRTIVPTSEEMNFIHDVIFNQLCLGVLNESAKNEFIAISKRLHARGAEGIILGCTEIPLLLSQDDLSFPIFDTTRLHALAAAKFSLGEYLIPDLVLE